uniref:Uncharacterized protein n=1 Tax=Arundo donax TaxID=35708 RepID=A0A0A9ES10_ARUDO
MHSAIRLDRKFFLMTVDVNLLFFMSYLHVVSSVIIWQLLIWLYQLLHYSCIGPFL